MLYPGLLKVPLGKGFQSNNGETKLRYIFVPVTCGKQATQKGEKLLKAHQKYKRNINEDYKKPPQNNGIIPKQMLHFKYSYNQK